MVWVVKRGGVFSREWWSQPPQTGALGACTRVRAVAAVMRQHTHTHAQRDATRFDIETHALSNAKTRAKTRALQRLYPTQSKGRERLEPNKNQNLARWARTFRSLSLCLALSSSLCYSTSSTTHTQIKLTHQSAQPNKGGVSRGWGEQSPPTPTASWGCLSGCHWGRGTASATLRLPQPQQKNRTPYARTKKKLSPRSPTLWLAAAKASEGRWKGRGGMQSKTGAGFVCVWCV